MDAMTKITEDLVPAAVAGLVGYVGSGPLVNARSTSSVGLLGYMPSEPMYFGIMTAVSRLFNSMTRDQILPYISEDGLIVGFDIASPVVTGGYLLAFTSINAGSLPDLRTALRVLVLGGVSDFVGGYAQGFV